MKFIRIVYLLFLIICFASSSTIQAQEVVLPKGYVCYLTDKPLEIDGKASENCWHGVEWTDDFVDIEGRKRPIPRFRTRAKMLWDKDYLYVFAELYDPHIWANLRQRDTVIFHDNDFEVFIDPDGDTHKYYEFEINALNTQWDLMLTKPYRNGGRPLTSWNFDKMKSAVNIVGTLNNPTDVDTCWSVEIAFPLKSFADSAVVIPMKAGTQWRINFSRVEWKTMVDQGRYVKIKNSQTGRPLPEDNWVWSPQGVVNMHCPETWGFIQFSNHVAGTKKEYFRPNPEEEVKMELRKLYFAQVNFSAVNKRLAANWGELSDFDPNLLKLNCKPQLRTNSKGYEISVARKSSILVWHINETGRVWSTSIK